MTINDIHTHDHARGHNAIINIYPGDAMSDGCVYSLGIHPWHTDCVTEVAIQQLQQQALDPRVVAIGETGLDKLRGASLDEQERIFLLHVQLSETLAKPLIIHSVKTVEQILVLHRRLRPRQRWIMHGFRGKPQQALSLLAEGLDISLGEKFNPLTAALIPCDRLMIESDESRLSIEEIRNAISKCRSMETPAEFQDRF